jgi:redox-sensing transcriptional repressor
MGGKNLSNISIAVVRRLPKYHRYLKDLLDKEVYRISSKELGKLIGFTASQIRQDLNCFGGFGQQGYGYNVEELYKEISRILGLNKNYNIIIIGAGNLGQAIANYTGFGKLGFELLALFDIDPRLIGMKIKGIPVLNMDKLDEFIILDKTSLPFFKILAEVSSQLVSIARVIISSCLKFVIIFISSFIVTVCQGDGGFDTPSP